MVKSHSLTALAEIGVIEQDALVPEYIKEGDDPYKFARIV